MENTRIMRLAEDVAALEYPRLELRKTIPASPDTGGHEILVWTVDGEYVRTFIDEEFTNFGQHYRFSQIPEFEFWLDKENENDESEYFMRHLIVEWEAMRAGKPYSTAIVEADREEMKLRRKDGDIKQMIDPKRKLVDPKRAVKRLLKSLENGVKVRLVNGKLVRSVLDIDFTQGGHSLVYEFVPEDEVWIDDDIDWKERGFVILHELNELMKMKDGWTYSKAHADSSALELNCRKNPDELHDALIAVGWE